MWTPAYIGIGSNLDDPQRQVTRGIAELATLPITRVIAISKLYRSKPMGPQDQPDYINAAAGLLTQLPSGELLAGLKTLEQRMGREHVVRQWGPRRIDFDVLAYGNLKSSGEELTVPHPGVAQRAFVLLPLLDIAPDVDVPGLGRVRALAQRVDATGVQAL